MSSPRLRRASFAELTPFEVYGLCRLRVDVFVVEQECPYPELDGRDTEPGTVHVWAERDGEIVGYIRILDDGDELRIGRVVTAKSARSGGLGGLLMQSARELVGERPSVLDAQSHLTRFYERFGYVADGPEFLEDGIPHIPMRRPNAASAG